ncbi:MAG: hypothetical protein J5I93_11290 [Pirellulaceae bacterium]|nr:hypothetical protein [Pirellulaceae bacterium]
MSIPRTLVCFWLILAGLVAGTQAQETPAEPTQAPGAAQPPDPSVPSAPSQPGNADAPADKPADAAPATKDPPGLTRLTKDYDLWIDSKRKLVVVDGKVCLREGQLEMFACPKGSKEHESIVALNSKSQFVHAALLAVGAKTGTPVRFNPEYQAATGTEVEVFVLWKDRDGKNRQVRAQDWIRNVKTGQAMTFPWVFAGSSFWVDEQTGERMYNADAGDLICVSNFPTAMLDLPVESSQGNADLLFEAFTERIPAIGTHVRLVLRPKPAAK